MRIVKVGVLAPTNKGIPLGVQGENRATQVEFDTRPWFREYPYGTVSAVARRDGDPAPYPLSLDVADGTAVWQVSDTDTAKAGEGAVELTMTSGGARVRSLTFKTLVTASLTDSPVDDDAWYGWLDKAVVKVDETVQSAHRKMDEVDAEWTGIKADVTEKVDELGEVAAQAASDAHHAKVDAQATAKALESAEGSVAKAEAAANRAVDASLAADDSAVEASNSALSAWESAEAASGSATNAATSASEAATSAGSAADAASAASGSASAAEQSATDASNAKVAAQTAKAEAATSAGNAATSASNAAKSATAAAKSASDAAASVGAINVIAPKNVNVPASSSDQFDIAIGQNANTTANQSIAIGVTSTASHLASVALGSFATTSKDYELAIGTLLENGADVTREITHVSAPTGPNSAATKSYVDANTSNALIGKVSGELLHVDDAFPSPVREFVVYGNSVQDGTPTPDAPVPIESVSELSVVSAGKNLIPYPYFSKSKVESGIEYTDNGDGSISVEGTNTSSAGATFDIMGSIYNSAYITFPAGTYKAYVKESISNNYAMYLSIRRDTYYGEEMLDGGGKFSGKMSWIFTLSEPTILFIRIGVNSKKTVVKTTVNVSLCASEDTDPYYPYVGSTTTNLLVSDDGTDYELRSLPDGTRDELVVRDGRRVLVKRVGYIEDVSSLVLSGDKTSDANPHVSFKIGTNARLTKMDDSANLMSRGYVGRFSNESGSVYMVDSADNDIIVFVNSSFTSKEVALELLSAMDAAFPLAAPETIDLGKADPILLPETVSNVWINDNLTPECTMTYKRDINIAFDNLVQAVVAAAAGE